MLRDTKRLRHNIRLLYVLNFCTNSEFLLPIYILFGHQYLHLSYFKAGSFFVLAWFVSIALDFVGGTVADRFGRKETYLGGMFLQILSYVPFLFSKSYPLLLFSSVIYGVGLALSSNSVDALVYEQAAELGAKQEYQRANANTQVFLFTGRVYASIVGGLTYKLDPRLPYALYIGVLAIALVAGWFIRLPKRLDHETNTPYLQTMRTALRTYRHTAGLIAFITVGGLFALWSNLLFSYYQPLFIELHASPAVLGGLFAGISVASAYGSYLMRKLPDRFSAFTIHSIDFVAIILSTIPLLFLGLPAALFTPIFSAIVSGFMYPNMRLFVNNHTGNAVRASVLSVASTAFSIGAGIGFLLSYSLVGHMSRNAILSLILVGCGIGLVLNRTLTKTSTVTYRQYKNDRPVTNTERPLSISE